MEQREEPVVVVVAVWVSVDGYATVVAAVAEDSVVVVVVVVSYMSGLGLDMWAELVAFAGTACVDAVVGVVYVPTVAAVVVVVGVLVVAVAGTGRTVAMVVASAVYPATCTYLSVTDVHGLDNRTRHAHCRIPSLRYHLAGCSDCAASWVHHGPLPV